ncbi:MAG: hypothetical protein RIC55_25645 [Pirellulaceae bacterium]
MPKLLAVSLLIASFASVVSVAYCADEPPPRPNVLIIMVDDKY